MVQLPGTEVKREWRESLRLISSKHYATDCEI